MNYYEHTYIASQSLNNKDLSDLHQKIEDLIKKNKGKIEKKEEFNENAVIGIQSAAGYAEGRPLFTSWKN